MFDKVADRYDLMNDVLSLGQDRWWRRIVARAVGAQPGELVLDLAAGTGTSSRTFTAGGASCVACDFSLGMLQVGAGRMRSARLRSAQPRSAQPRPAQPRSAQPGRPAGEAAGCAGPVRFVAGDALQLPFRDQAFDAVTISFGLRNVADPGAALGEMLRVTRPGAGWSSASSAICRGPGSTRCMSRTWPRRCRRSRGGSPAARKPTTTWRSPSGTGPLRLSWRAGWPRPGGQQYAGGISPWAWWPCTWRAARVDGRRAGPASQAGRSHCGPGSRALQDKV